MPSIRPRHCLRIRKNGQPCGRTWWPRRPERPARCPKCGSVRWDRPPKPAPAEGQKE